MLKHKILYFAYLILYVQCLQALRIIVDIPNFEGEISVYKTDIASGDGSAIAEIIGTLSMDNKEIRYIPEKCIQKISLINAKAPGIDIDQLSLETQQADSTIVIINGDQENPTMELYLDIKDAQMLKKNKKVEKQKPSELNQFRIDLASFYKEFIKAKKELDSYKAEFATQIQEMQKLKQKN
jgi:hypothetical protein